MKVGTFLIKFWVERVSMSMFSFVWLNANVMKCTKSRSCVNLAKFLVVGVKLIRGKSRKCG